MAYQRLDRTKVKMESLDLRDHQKDIEQIRVTPDQRPETLSPHVNSMIADTALQIQTARNLDHPVMLTFGAHTIKNGLAPVLIDLLQSGWITHLSTNGAGIIHDWEFAFQGKSCEDVRQMVRQGRFGNWEETGFWINLALAVGAYENRGYGESIGALIEREGLQIPEPGTLVAEVQATLSDNAQQSAAAADLLAIVRDFELAPGWHVVPHRWKADSIQAAAFAAGIPFTGHPMIGHDIIYNHPMNRGAAVGRTAERDFLTFAESVTRLEGGVYLSVGSAIMSPMVFEKSLSMAQNLALQQGQPMSHYYLLIVDLASSTWDWTQGEPPEGNPAYYLRYNKTFSRMGGTMRYLTCDNRDFLLTLRRCLQMES